MSIIKVYTDDGKLVSQMQTDDAWSIFTLGRKIYGRQEAPLGWLGRALSDARIIQVGGDPERPSEKAIRFAMAERAQVESSMDRMERENDSRAMFGERPEDWQ